MTAIGEIGSLFINQTNWQSSLLYNLHIGRDCQSSVADSPMDLRYRVAMNQLTERSGHEGE